MDEGRPRKLDKMDTLVGTPQQRGCVGYGGFKMGGEERDGWEEERARNKEKGNISKKAMLEIVKLRVAHKKKNTKKEAKRVERKRRRTHELSTG